MWFKVIFGCLAWTIGAAACSSTSTNEGGGAGGTPASGGTSGGSCDGGVPAPSDFTCPTEPSWFVGTVAPFGCDCAKCAAQMCCPQVDGCTDIGQCQSLVSCMREHCIPSKDVTQLCAETSCKDHVPQYGTFKTAYDCLAASCGSQCNL